MAPEKLTIEQERELFERLKADPEAIGEVYDRFAGQLYSFLLKRSGHKQIAEDIVAQVFIKLLESAPNLEWKGVSIGAWLYRVAANALADHWRSSVFRKTQEIDPDVWDPPSLDDPEWNTEIKLEGERLKEAMDELSERDQQVLTLRFFAGYETEDIAKEFAITNNHAAVLVYRALGRMRKELISKP